MYVNHWDRGECGDVGLVAVFPLGMHRWNTDVGAAVSERHTDQRRLGAGCVGVHVVGVV